MAYPKSLELDIELREVMFLHLARQSSLKIGELLKCCPRKVTDYNARLMELFCGSGKTDMVQVYSNAKANLDLCKWLADEFRHRYPKLAPIVESSVTIEFLCSIENGKKKTYIRRG